MQYLDFEKNVAELESKVSELRQLAPSDEDISIVQSGDEQIPIGSKVTISIGTNTRIIISE